MANSLSVNDISAVVNAVLTNAQGGSATANTSDFTTIAQIALQQGYDPLTTAISQVTSRTIFSQRSYNAQFKGLYKDAVAYGNHIRKLNMIDKPVEADRRLVNAAGTPYVDGDEADQYKIAKPEVLQTNFYGQQNYQKSLTIWSDQLDTAFSSPAEFGNFLTMIMSNANDQLGQVREDLARGAVVNLIGATATVGTVRHLLTEYNTATGLALTATTVMLPENFKAFMQWFFATLKTTMDMLKNRQYLNHVNPYVGGVKKLIRRHTPLEYQHCYMLGDFINKSETMALSNTFHEDYLKKMDYEIVDFWQKADDIHAIDTTVSYLSAGSAETPSAITTAAYANNNVIGIIFDDEAAGINLINQRSAVTPFNAMGCYYNQFWHETARWFNDNTENAIVLALD